MIHPRRQSITINHLKYSSGRGECVFHIVIVSNQLYLLFFPMSKEQSPLNYIYEKIP